MVHFYQGIYGHFLTNTKALTNSLSLKCDFKAQFTNLKIINQVLHTGPLRKTERQQPKTSVGLCL